MHRHVYAVVLLSILDLRILSGRVSYALDSRTCTKETVGECDGPPNERVLQGVEVAVVGGSLGGLAASNVLTQLGASVTLFEQYLHGFEQRGGGLGVDASLFQEIRQTSEDEIRRLPAPWPVPNVPPGGGYFYGDTWQFLYEGLPENSIQYGVTITGIQGADSNRPELEITERVSDTEIETHAVPTTSRKQAFDLVVLADGGWSELRHYVLSPEKTEDKHISRNSSEEKNSHVHVKPLYAGYVLWRGLIKYSMLPAGWNAWGNFRSGNFTFISYPIRDPTDEEDVYVNTCAYVAMPEDEVSKPQSRVNRMLHSTIANATRTIMPKWFIPLMKQQFDDKNAGIAQMYEILAQHGKFKPHPVWEFAAPNMFRKRLLLLGDSAHLASPNTGAGAHTALLDAQALRNAFLSVGSSDRDTILEQGLLFYNEEAVTRSEGLLRASKEVGLRYVPFSKEAVVSPAELVATGGRTSEVAGE